MSDEQGKKVKDGVKKGASVVGKVVKWVIIAILLIVVVVIAYSCYACTSVTKAVVDATTDSSLVKDVIRDATADSTHVKDVIRDATSVEDRTKMSSEAISVTAADLYNAYESNALRADNTYKGKYVRVTGRVSGVNQDLLTKEPYVKLHTDNPYMDFVYIYFKDTELSRVIDLESEQTIAIVGNCEGKGVLSVNIKDAFFE